MFVIEKNEDGNRYIRPAFIGFIKNNYARRFACLFFYPLTFAVTLVFNVIVAVFISILVIIRAVIKPFRDCVPMWKTNQSQHQFASLQL